MTIGIDLRVLTRDIHTGVEEYTEGLLSHLLYLAPNIKFRLFYNGFFKIKLNYPWRKLANVEIKNFSIPNRLINTSSYFLNCPKIDKLLGGIDLFFSPHFIFSPLSKGCPKVVTFHDLSFEHYPHFFSLKRKIWHRLVNPKKQAKTAEKIIAVSQSTKQDLINFYGIRPSKIKVIYSGIGEEFKTQNSKLKTQNHILKVKTIKKKYNLPEKFILYFGTIEPRKNIIGLIKAFEQLKLANLYKSDLKLVIAGSPGWLYQDVFKTAQESKYKNDIIFTGFIEDKDKPYLYNLAEVFVYPSFFEGFGFPPLEAMACGLPVITSNTSSFPEIVGDSAIMVDPYKIDEISFALKEVLTDKNLREELIKRGLKQVKKFSWQSCAQQTLKTLTE